MLRGRALTDRVLALCQEAGFARAGICAARGSDREAWIRRWLGDGKHGEMGYLAERVETMLDPARALAGVRSIVMVADRYATRDDGPDEVDPGRGRVARYARGRDYHRVIKRRLHGLADTLREELGEAGGGAGIRSFVDTAPVLEREHAARAGLGWVGKHTLLIDPELGSYLFLGGILTTLEIPEPVSQAVVSDHCGTCTRCIDACPTDAITPYSVDGTRCVSYLTLEHRSAIDESMYAGVGDWIAGCDICQEVCPHNSARPTAGGPLGGAAGEAYAPARTGFDLLEVLGWDEEARRAALRSSSLKRVRLGMFKRNALIAVGNAWERLDSGARAALLRRVRALARSEDEPGMVRETARRVLLRIGD